MILYAKIAHFFLTKFARFKTGAKIDFAPLAYTQLDGTIPMQYAHYSHQYIQSLRCIRRLDIENIFIDYEELFI